MPPHEILSREGLPLDRQSRLSHLLGIEMRARENGTALLVKLPSTCLTTRAPQRVAAKSPQKIYRSQLMLGFDHDGDPLRTLRQWLEHDLVGAGESADCLQS